MNKDVNKENREIYRQFRDQVINLQSSNSENYDKAILSLSSAALGLSVVFLKDILPIEKIIKPNFLICSWILFVSSIISTILSFIFSQWGLKIQIKHAEKYYLENDNDYFNKKNIFGTFTTILNHFSGIFFIFAIIITVYFVTVNINNIRSNKMVKEKKRIELKKEIVTGGAEIPFMQKKNTIEIQEGQKIPKMTKISGKTVEKGAEVPSMQPAVPNTTNSGQNSNNSNSQNSTQNTNSDKGNK